MVQGQNGNPEAALVSLSQATVVDTSNTDARCQLGARLAMTQPAKVNVLAAIEQYRLALLHDPKHFDANYNLALNLHHRPGLHQDMREEGALLATTPSYIEATIESHYRTALANSYPGNTAEAEANYNFAMFLDDVLQRSDEAAEHYSRAMEGGLAEGFQARCKQRAEKLCKVSTKTSRDTCRHEMNWVICSVAVVAIVAVALVRW